MTNQEFDNSKLSTKLTFRESESARVILVHGFDVQLASELYGVKIVKIKEIVILFNDAIKC